jgi:hypothetical protein
MANDYQPELWRDLYVMLGTSAGALVGLLFIVTSLHLEEIMNNAFYQIRARNNMYYLLTLLGQAGLILTPQPMRILGSELIVISLLLLLFHLRNLYLFQLKDKESSKRGGVSPFNSVRYIVSDLIGIAGAACLLGQLSWGLYLVTASYFIFLIAVILNAWTIMFGVGQAEKIAKVT